jgi:hypothetical protein
MLNYLHGIDGGIRNTETVLMMEQMNRDEVLLEMTSCHHKNTVIEVSCLQGFISKMLWPRTLFTKPPMPTYTASGQQGRWWV